MSWTLAVFEFKGEPLPSPTIFEAADYTPPVMGSRAAIQNAISAVWNGINWQALDIFFERSDVAVNIYLAPAKPLATQASTDMISCVLLTVGYDPAMNPYPYLETLCRATGRTVYDTVIRTFLQFPKPNTAGLELMRQHAAKRLS
ncbi:MAG: hypothetical protein AAF708_04455 [Deinococcota bacterium]